MMRPSIFLLLVTWLAGCATPVSVSPSELDLGVSPRKALAASAEMLMARGYVIRHADDDLGRLEAVLSRWPGYRVHVRITGEDDASRVSLVAFRGGRPLPPRTLDALVADLRDYPALGR
ncbi:hypothetical protein [Halomonas daqiaonensis]|uniref:Lipoprotein n=1 Tax=Halomonas daqiaonensis TaxID=650850 RepID=A0A1H7RBQ8_9GAMM|nr:hypothetical protein [Halomonas daqiaonensis]SEL57344.1 hypothetical protein SAMN04488129_11232 [Halomonas daqiaonensis]